MIEILLALAIFLIGFVLVAMIFPAAILLQKRTVDEVISQEIARSAESLLRAKMETEPAGDFTARLTVAHGPGWDTDYSVVSFPPEMLKLNLDPMITAWTAMDRSSPSTLINDAGNIPAVARRRFHWVPLVQDAATGPGWQSYQVYLFVLQRRDNTNYNSYPLGGSVWANPDDADTIPRVRRIGITPSATDQYRAIFANQDFDGDNANDGGLTATDLLLHVGDQVLDNNGLVRIISLADANGVSFTSALIAAPNAISAIWCAPSGFQTGTTIAAPFSPIQAIVILSPGVVQP